MDKSKEQISVKRGKVACNFSLIPNEIQRGRHMTNLAKLLWSYIYGMDESYQFSVYRITEDFIASEKTIRNALKELESLDLLKRTRIARSNRVVYEISYEADTDLKKRGIALQKKLGENKQAVNSTASIPEKQAVNSTASQAVNSTAVKNINFKEEKETPKPPSGAGGILSPEELASVTEKKSTRKPRKERTRKQAKKKASPTAMVVEFVPNAPPPWKTVVFNSFEEQADYVTEAYRKMVPSGSGRGDGRRHVLKILKSGAYSLKQLLLAIERYEEMKNPVWSLWTDHISHIDRSAATEEKYYKGMNNFFGRERVFEQYAVRGYKAYIEEEDWQWFNQFAAIGQNAIASGRNTRMTLKELLTHRCRFDRFVQLYGYTPMQHTLPYERRFEVC
jgi:hypothetical protein